MNIYKCLRKREKLTQEELASRLHLNQATVSKWEKEKSIPDVDTLINLANLYNCSIDYLLGRDIYEQQKKPDVVGFDEKEDNFTIEQKQCIEILKTMTPTQVERTHYFMLGLTEQNLESVIKNKKERL